MRCIRKPPSVPELALWQLVAQLEIVVIVAIVQSGPASLLEVAGIHKAHAGGVHAKFPGECLISRWVNVLQQVENVSQGPTCRNMSTIESL